MTQNWDKRFVLLAKHISDWSKDPSTKVGAVIFDNNHRIISCGYNGLPQGIEDAEEILNNREVKYKYVIHAEQNSILFAKCDLTGYNIATYPLMPCSSCAKLIVQMKIKRVISIENDNPRWKEDMDISRKMFEEAGIELKLFKDIP